MIAMEYPSYGIYNKYDKSQDVATLILEDAEYLYDYLTTVVGI